MSNVVVNSYRFAGETCLPTSTRGNCASGSQFARSCKTNYFTRYGSSISGGLEAGLNFNRVGMKFDSVASGALNSTTYQCMYTGASARVGSGQQDPFSITSGVKHYSVTDAYCTTNDEIWHGWVNTSTSCSDCCNAKSGSAGITAYGQYINYGDENQLRSTANGGSGDYATHGTSAEFDHTDA